STPPPPMATASRSATSAPPCARCACPYVGTKLRVPPEARDTAAAVTQSVDASLQRLGMEGVDLIQLHNPIRADGSQDNGLPLRRVLDEVLPAMEALRRQGKTRFIGITALGDTSALHSVLESGRIDTAQVCVNLLNPTAIVTPPAG